MKSKLLPAAMLAGLAGAASTSHVVPIHTQTLIYPYFTLSLEQPRKRKGLPTSSSSTPTVKSFWSKFNEAVGS